MSSSEEEGSHESYSQSEHSESEGDVEAGSENEQELHEFSEFLDPHLERSFTALKEQFEKKSSWKSVESREDIPMRVTKIYGITKEESQASLVHPAKFKPKLHEAWKQSVEAETDELDDMFLPFQQELIGPLSMYQDAYILNADAKLEDEYRRMIMLHAMNHVLKIRDRVLHHNQANAVATAGGKPIEDDRVMRDQGFTRPRVLIICPMRNVAYDLVQMIIELWTLAGATIDGKKRFEDEYGEPKDEDGDPLESSGPDPSKSTDFNRIFRGNIDDCFRIGLKFTRKSLKLFADFYSSDIIIASPLGLRLVIDGQKEKVPTKGARNPHAKRARKADADFLSSINICLIDGADVIHMQNWDHLEYVLEHVNAMPVNAHGCDFSRVQTVYLENVSRKTRQTIVLSKFAFPDLNSLLGKPSIIDTCLGKWKFESNFGSRLAKKASEFIIPKFHRFAPKSLESHSEDRLKYFTEIILPQYRNKDHIAIFVSSYFDYCQLKQWFAAEGLSSVAHLSEYEEGGAITGARAKFFNGHAKFLLVTERFYFYRRLKIRGVKHLLWYSLPDHPEYFLECSQWVGDIHKRAKDEDEGGIARPPKTESPVLYSQFDWLKLERIAGSSMIEKLL